MRAPSIIMCIPVSSVSNGGNFLAQLLLSTATHTILQYIMSAKLGHERFEHSHKSGLIETIPKIYLACCAQILSSLPFTDG